MGLSDIWIDEDGEIMLDEDGDLKVAVDNDAIAQSVIFRLKTVEGDFLLQPECGASIETILGLPNTEDTGKILEELIIGALTHDGFIVSEYLNVTSVPVSPTEIFALVEVLYDPNNPVNVMVDVDLKEGQVKYLRV